MVVVVCVCHAHGCLCCSGCVITGRINQSVSVSQGAQDMYVDVAAAATQLPGLHTVHTDTKCQLHYTATMPAAPAASAAAIQTCQAATRQRMTRGGCSNQPTSSLSSTTAVAPWLCVLSATFESSLLQQLQTHKHTALCFQPSQKPLQLCFCISTPVW